MEMLYCWKELIPGGDSFQKTNKICDIHFEEGAVIKEIITKIPDVTYYVLKEIKPYSEMMLFRQFFLNQILQVKNKFLKIAERVFAE